MPLLIGVREEGESNSRRKNLKLYYQAQCVYQLMDAGERGTAVGWNVEVLTVVQQY